MIKKIINFIFFYCSVTKLMPPFLLSLEIQKSKITELVGMNAVWRKLHLTYKLKFAD